MIDADVFEKQRSYLFSIAYRMLGSAAEAEDVVQDAWLRAAGAPEDLRSPRAFLATVVARLSLDRLKSARAARESYVGPWLPEPVIAADLPAPDADLERLESVRMAFLVLLEALSPQERAAFLLRQVFDFDYAEIAPVLGASEASCRQLVHRAMERIGERRPRFRPAPARQREIVDRFLAAARGGDLVGLTACLRADVAFAADGGGKVPAAGRPLQGADSVGRLVHGLWTKAAARVAAGGRVDVTRVELNAEPALLVFVEGRLETAFVFSVESEGIAAIHAIRNPEKLSRLASRVPAPATPGDAAG